MKNAEKIPILKPNELDKLHFGQVDWQLPVKDASHFFHINRVEAAKDKLNFPLPPHRKTVHDLIFLTKGKSIRTKGLNQYEFGAGQFFFLPALQLTTHEMMSKDAEGFFIHFDVEIFKRNGLERHLNHFSFLDFLSNPIVAIPESLRLPILNIFERLEEIYLEEKTEDYSIIALYLLTLFKEVAAFVIVENNKSKNSSAILSQKYKEALSQHIYQKQKVSDYADLLNVTPNHLNKCIKNITNKSAQELLNEMLILEAKSLLKYSNLQIAEIAVKLFNQTPSNFARFFKSQTGITPKEYQ